ncbi:hypothetical protein PhaeoP23_02573 [Phaeobacter piscinae]|uniref:DUF4238 domain-containing protein n=1 Tax=Phaeobacter piscinae TaxID=1580596 RepID=A0AAN1LAK0_9RHOB|nr:DUF4238 domain-containing protein [Phaeobacter piscinae]ATG36683.1 hypothetical protein PhaeoP36_02573 [Phaeobacter piscinae]ATG43682.1 hypothetical protein PhaeoP13_01745 [Phaeobacter piscinae]AUQ87204.1 hypothetical protein PhaeoP42_02574 [Phaeobacter piscinae]AUR25087.1 hypothetical protein PhaeoP23_02573 [Phaeobacter piscinae]
MATKANHHFIPQFYLRGFADGVGRKARVFTFDSETRTTFKTLVRNVGSRRHFFRVEADGVDPNYVEDAMAKIEGEIALHLADVIQTKSFPTPEHFNSVMNLLANVSVRNPRLRGNMSQFHKDIVQRMTHLSLSSKEVWEGQVDQIREEGIPLKDDISYEDIKRFIESSDYEIVIDQTYLIGLELQMIEPVLECSARRNWCFVAAPEGHQYICSDDPVVLSWIDDRKTGPYSPGHGVGGTLVTFPLSPELLLVGTFEELPEHLKHAPVQVTSVNTRTARYSTKQIYARDGSFLIDLHDRPEVRGEDLPHFYDKQLPA